MTQSDFSSGHGDNFSRCGCLWPDKRSSAMDARITIVLEQITLLRLDHKERIDDHEIRLRRLEQQK